ncbi:hypothetical protein [Nitrosarchaeum koreense]|uniref:Uncharacterized protein n=1 Tax=Nitrosarchaeum koreense MY1 TaxID=1001994 RepID=F9CVA7_9ARCH|nr:hypothetical protein [Nitrosarchaeum koreense]EGP94733.1 hypothetical protein MY1_1989 [Nitrosarchaeum koreense MY1]
MDFRTDKAAYKVTLKESFTINDGTVFTNIFNGISLSESLSLVDSVNALPSVISLTESLSFNDGTIDAGFASQYITAYAFPSSTTGSTCSNPTLVTADDGSNAACIDNQILVLKNFGFTTGTGGGLQIPSDAYIEGIEFKN